MLENQDTNQPEIDWAVTLFVLITPIAALMMVPLHIVLNGLSWPLILLLVIYGGASNLSITAGYHRLFSHQSYSVSTWVKAIYLFVGAGAFQGSALKWGTDHRRHHRFVDTDLDPYNINRGFFFAHMGWLFWKTPSHLRDQWAQDLKKDPWIWLQHKYYVPLAIVSGFMVPTYIGWAMGSPFGGFVFGGLLRIVVTQHSTFLINSYCHYFGQQTYGKKNSAKDSLIMAFFTHGEGYHNFHHHFQADYRNGIRWYDWDPTKWLIKMLALFGAARGLRKVPAHKILQMQLEEQRKSLIDRGAREEWILKLKQQIEDSQLKLQKVKAELIETRMQLKRASQEKWDELNIRYRHLKFEAGITKKEFKYAYAQWCYALKRSRILVS